MKCPECGTKLHEVNDSRKRGNEIYRRRECFNGHRFSTLETVVQLSAARVISRGNKKHPQELVNQCHADREAGNTLAVISVERGIPEDTLRDWFYRGSRLATPKEQEA